MYLNLLKWIAENRNPTHTTRIYDLTRQPQMQPSNPHWPPGKHQSMAGPAHGLHMYESEGEGLGRCMFVLMGGRSGGHQAAVLASVKYAISIICHSI
jgi:hypothetical protein